MQDNEEVLGTRLQNGMFGVPDLHPDAQHPLFRDLLRTG